MVDFKYYGSLNKNESIFQTNALRDYFTSLFSSSRTWWLFWFKIKSTEVQTSIPHDFYEALMKL